jgi:methylmalonyl-CoA/ethylmalonyl-CoA epimerase
MTLHHIGYVVRSIQESLDGMTRSLGYHCSTGSIFEPIQRVNVIFLSPPSLGPQIELVEPHSEQSPVWQFVQKGGGLHHICYEVEDLSAQLDRMRAIGAGILRKPQPAAAFEGRRIAWVVTRERLLLEYLERDKQPCF